MKILYVLYRFPSITHTFILDEITELIRIGEDIEIISVEIPNDIELKARTGFKLHELKNRITYLSTNQILAFEFSHPLFTRSVSTLHYELWKDKNRYLRCLAAVLTNIMLKKDYDCVHTHFIKQLTKSILTATLKAKLPLTITTHAYDLYRNDRLPESELRTIVNYASKIITISEYNKKYINSIIGNSCGSRTIIDKIRVIYCGINPQQYPYLFKANSSRILTVARLVEKKGIEILLQAIALLKSNYKLEGDVKFDIVGDGPQLTHLLNLKSKLKLGKGVVNFHGIISDYELKKLYGDCCMFVLPCIVARDGDRDGIPVTLIEAMAMGIPVISTDISGIPELITSGVNGLLVKAGDAEALATAIYTLYNDRKLRLKFSMNGRKLIKQKFNITKNVRQLVAEWW